MGLLDGKVAFVTGASRGQGRSHAVRLAEEGADIIGIDICADIDTVPYPLGTEEELEETARLVEKTGRQALVRQADVRHLAQLRTAVADGVAQFGHIDVVAANAAISVLGAADSDEDDTSRWEDVIAVNLTGVWNTLRACAPPMVERGQGGSIILTSSSAGLKGVASAIDIGQEAYVASKHGVVGLMRQYALQLGRHDIRVNSVHPTAVNTPMIHNAAIDQFVAEHPDAFATFTHPLPIDALEPRDISDAVLFLASDLALHITGVTLSVDAGYNIK